MSIHTFFCFTEMARKGGYNSLAPLNPPLNLAAYCWTISKVSTSFGMRASDRAFKDEDL